jgi:hypothetical protein
VHRYLLEALLFLRRYWGVLAWERAVGSVSISTPDTPNQKSWAVLVSAWIHAFSSGIEYWVWS